METIPDWLREQPYVWALSTVHLKRYCSYCLQRRTPKRTMSKCGNCNFVYYCSPECQKYDWAEHKTECKQLKNVFIAKKNGEIPDNMEKEFPDDMPRMMSRLVQKLQKEKDASTETVVSGRAWSDIPFDIKGMKDSEQQYEEYQTFCDRYALYVGRTPWKLHEKRMELNFCKAKNAMLIITDDKMQPIGRGIYLSVSRVKHSCAPNARPMFDGRRVNLLPTEYKKFDESELDWNRITISRINNLIPVFERKKVLKEMLNIEECDCVGCQDDDRNDGMTAYACPKFQCTGQVIQTSEEEDEEQEFTCKKCKHVLSKDEMGRIGEAMKFAGDSLPKLNDPQTDPARKLEIAEKAVSKATRTLYKYNVVRIRLFSFAHEYSMLEAPKAKKKERAAVWQKSANYGEEVYQAYAHYLGEYDPVRLMFAAQLSSSFINAGDKESAMELMFNSQGKYKHMYPKNSDGLNDILRVIKNADLS